MMMMMYFSIFSITISYPNTPSGCRASETTQKSTTTQSLTNRILKRDTIISDTPSLSFNPNNRIPTPIQMTTNPPRMVAATQNLRERNIQQWGRGRERGWRQQSPHTHMKPTASSDHSYPRRIRRTKQSKSKFFFKYPSTLSEETLEHYPDEKLLDVYDDEHIDPLERWNQEQLDDVERTMRKDQQRMQQEDEEYFDVITTAENYDHDNALEQQRYQEEWNEIQIQSMQSQFSTLSYTNITDELELLDDEQTDTMNERKELQLRIREESLS